MKQIKATRVAQPHTSLCLDYGVQSVGSCPETVCTLSSSFNTSSEISGLTPPSSPLSAGPGPSPGPSSQNSAHHTACDKSFFAKEKFQTYSFKHTEP